MAVNISSIGSGGGRDYANIPAWETATAAVASGDVEIGELYADGAAPHFTGQGRFNKTGAGTRVLRVAAGQEYNPLTGTGVKWFDNTQNVCVIEEDDFVLQGGILIEQGYVAASGNRKCVTVQTGYTGVKVTKVAVLHTGLQLAGTGSLIFVKGSSTEADISNCILFNNVNPLFSPEYGIEHEGTGLISHCAAIGFNRGVGVGSGVYVVNGTGVTVKNTAVANSGGDDFDVHASATEDHNVSSDASAAGSNSHTNEAAADIFDNLVALTPNRMGVCINGGEDLSASSGAQDYDGNYTDFEGVDHDNDGRGVEIGPWNYDTTLTVSGNIEAHMTLGFRLRQEPSSNEVRGAGAKGVVVMPGATKGRIASAGTDKGLVAFPGAKAGQVVTPGATKGVIVAPGSTKGRIA